LRIDATPRTIDEVLRPPTLELSGAEMVFFFAGVTNYLERRTSREYDPVD
jgi:hypothetical protein